MDFLISLLAGLFGCGVVGYALYKGFKQFTKIEDFIEKVVKMPKVTKWWRESPSASWIGFLIIIGTMFYVTIEIAQWIGKNLAGVEY